MNDFPYAPILTLLESVKLTKSLEPSSCHCENCQPCSYLY